MSMLRPVSQRVSSVLNDDRKQFGGKYLFDGKDETCWNSDQGLPQWVLMEFDQLISVKRIAVQFQGGFVGKECELLAVLEKTESNKESSFTFYPKDSNGEQEFECTDLPPSKKFRLIFKSSTDFYGRITVYHLKVYCDFHPNNIS